MRLLKRATRRTLTYVAESAETLASFIGYPLVARVRRRPNRWVFGHQDGLFSGNPKYLYLWLLRNTTLDVSWITGSWRTWRQLRRNGCPAALRWSPAGMYRTATAGAAFFAHRTADINATLVNGALLVNLWHGVGLKAIQSGHANGLTSHAQRYRASRIGRARFRTYLTPPDYVATTSTFMQRHFADQFGLPEGCCPQIGYPRIDVARDVALAKDAAAFDERFVLPPSGFERTLAYVPTSRDSNRPLLPRAIPDPRRLSEALANARAYLYVKLHPRTRETLPVGLSNISVWPADVDMQTHLQSFDAIITDYSSILYDYLAVRSAGVALYVFDLDEYLRADRDLLYPFEENVAGSRIRSFEELCESIESGAIFEAVDPDELATIRTRFWGKETGSHARRVTEFVCQRLGLALPSASAAPMEMPPVELPDIRGRRSAADDAANRAF